MRPMSHTIFFQEERLRARIRGYSPQKSQSLLSQVNDRGFCGEASNCFESGAVHRCTFLSWQVHSARWNLRTVPKKRRAVYLDTVCSSPTTTVLRRLNGFQAFPLESLMLSQLSETQRWQSDEPYSSRPAVFGSFIASFVFGDYSM